MSKKKVWFWISIGFIVFALVVGASFFLIRSSNSVSGEGDYEVYAEKVSDLMGLGNMMGDMGAYAAFSGKVEAEKMEKIYYDPEKGTIKEMLVSEGDVVEEGTKLLEYEPAEDLSFEKDQKQIELEKSYMDINRLKKQKDRLEKQMKEGNFSSSSPSENEEALEIVDKETLQQELDQVTFDIRMANLQAGQLEKELEALKGESLSVVAKTPGIVQSINQDLLQGAPYGENNASSGPLLTIVPTGAYLIKSEVNELLLDTIAVGDSVRITTKKGQEGEWIGEIIEIGKLPVDMGAGGDAMGDMYYMEEGNPQTSKYPFTVLLEEHEGLEIGFHVNLEPTKKESEQDSTPEGIIIPVDYIIQEEEPYVWAVDVETNEVFKQMVEFTIMDDGFMAEILNGITPDDAIVYPAPSVKEGKKVEIFESDTTEEN